MFPFLSVHKRKPKVLGSCALPVIEEAEEEGWKEEEEEEEDEEDKEEGVAKITLDA